ncbi:methyltransferase [Lipingzhangella sp. LS1_29]|uniref:Methyltransferase n=1 Tax=Lipingzhangella rawalii TaxID=2055835 RepID=A0ABU2H657_9ACTN|nr:methyltransferase [Lipingzhangella rawalii]MDS1270787.1 methyltransferase [Lipingzhangella rawalii]
MADTGSYELGLSETQCHAAETESAGPQEFELLGLRWELLPGVFAPFHSRSTESYTSWLPLHSGDSFLEMGCGAGVTAVYAALAHGHRTTALDVSAAAVENTQVNAARHGVPDRVDARQSDMFDALDPQERFDIIFWNSSAIPAPASFTYTRDIEWSIFDRDYESHRRYLQEGPRYLTERGRLFLGFNTNGDVERLQELAAESGLHLREIQSRTTTYDGQTTARFMLLELLPARTTAAPVPETLR